MVYIRSERVFLMNIRKIAFILLFLIGGLLAATANLQITIGAALMILGYSEFKRQNIDLSEIDDVLLEEIKKLIKSRKSEETNE